MKIAIFLGPTMPAVEAAHILNAVYLPPARQGDVYRLVRDHHINRCDCTSLALYLFLVTVSDGQGLSYYSDAAICRRLKIDLLELSHARALLQKVDLIAFGKPFYQVLPGTGGGSAACAQGGACPPGAIGG